MSSPSSDRRLAAERIAADRAAAAKTPSGKPANAASPYGPEQAFNRARMRLASLHEDEDADRFVDA